MARKYDSGVEVYHQRATPAEMLAIRVGLREEAIRIASKRDEHQRCAFYTVLELRRQRALGR